MLVKVANMWKFIRVFTLGVCTFGMYWMYIFLFSKEVKGLKKIQPDNIYFISFRFKERMIDKRHYRKDCALIKKFFKKYSGWTNSFPENETVKGIFLKAAGEASGHWYLYLEEMYTPEKMMKEIMRDNEISYLKGIFLKPSKKEIESLKNSLKTVDVMYSDIKTNTKRKFMMSLTDTFPNILKESMKKNKLDSQKRYLCPKCDEENKILDNLSACLNCGHYIGRPSAKIKKTLDDFANKLAA